jgi:hypothetical protein
MHSRVEGHCDDHSSAMEFLDKETERSEAVQRTTYCAVTTNFYRASTSRQRGWSSKRRLACYHLLLICKFYSLQQASACSLHMPHCLINVVDFTMHDISFLFHWYIELYLSVYIFLLHIKRAQTCFKKNPSYLIQPNNLSANKLALMEE